MKKNSLYKKTTSEDSDKTRKTDKTTASIFVPNFYGIVCFWKYLLCVSLWN